MALKKRLSVGTFAVDLDPLSLLTRRSASVPPPRFHIAFMDAYVRDVPEAKTWLRSSALADVSGDVCRLTAK